ncbi:glycoside hydrolase family 55 protein [Bisporella sp. PMI_857]|nr:glycoside hydrolase family 55 protein [Bisporella sp. PMI_857]
MENVKHQGKASFNTDSSYQVWRNVKDFGAKGDGITDDTAAINLAISSGSRCAPGKCESSTTTPAQVYFPNGTYLVSSPIIDYYYTQIIGNPNCMPVIKASSGFSDRWVIDGNQYQPGGALGYGSTNLFWRGIRNLVIDMTSVSPSLLVAGIHWPTAQATSLQNILFKMSTASNTQHEGMFIESGSGGFMTDLTFYGGLNGITVGNQQFTMRNLTFYNAVTAINQLWDWGWTYKGVSINNCGRGIYMAGLNNGAQAVGSVTLIDSSITNTPIGIVTARGSSPNPITGGSLILENVRLNNVPVAVQGPNSNTVLAGSTSLSTISAWGQGHSYTPTGPTVFQGTIAASTRPSSLVSGTDYYERSKPQYANLPASQFVSVRNAGAKGDGVTDDSDILNLVLFTAASAGKVVFFDAGNYLVTKTIYVPPGSKIVGEAFPVILSSGSFFATMSNPQPVVKVGLSGKSGAVEWSDMIVSTKGAQAGAILIQWNLASPTASPSGMWDVHTRIGGFAGSGLQLADCPKTPEIAITKDNLVTKCIAAFMSMHVTASATGLYLENVWLWVADHDVEDATVRQITIYAGRGLLIESTLGGIWLVGTSVEHHVLYEYQLSKTQNIFLGQIQTETAYYQPNPDATIPFAPVTTYHDPVFAKGQSGWGLRIVDSKEIYVYGAGLYSFFSNYSTDCSTAAGNTQTCQSAIFSVESSQSVRVYNLNTIGTTNMLSIDGVVSAPYASNNNGFVNTIALFKL